MSSSLAPYTQTQGYDDSRCPPFYSFCAGWGNAFCDADKDCVGDHECCGPDCKGNAACPAGSGCCRVELETTADCPPFFPFCSRPAPSYGDWLKFESKASGLTVNGRPFTLKGTQWFGFGGQHAQDHLNRAGIAPNLRPVPGLFDDNAADSTFSVYM